MEVGQHGQLGRNVHSHVMVGLLLELGHAQTLPKLSVVRIV